MRAKQGKRFIRKVGVGLSKAILIALFTGAVAVAPGGVAGALKILGDYYEGQRVRDFDEEKIRRALRYLQSRKLVDIQSQYQKEAFRLTKLGRRRVRKLLKSFGIPKPKKWDGKWRVVVFDIPETKKEKRELFRRALKNLGLANVQKSIWAHPYECRDQVYYLAGNLFIRPYLRYIVAEEITGGTDLAQRFDLSP